jgi:hypothetical protein
MSSFWSDACNNARNKPLQQQLDAAYGSCGATVSTSNRALASASLHHTFASAVRCGQSLLIEHASRCTPRRPHVCAAQVIAYCVAAVASGTMCLPCSTPSAN